MDKNTILGLLVIAGLLIGYSMFTRPSKEEQAEVQRVRDSIAVAEQIRMQEQQRQLAEDAQSAPASTELAAPEEKPVSMEEQKDIYGAFAAGANGTREYITLENDKISLKVSNLGGRPYSVQLKEYQTHDSLPLILFNGDSTVFGMNFFAQNRSINTNELFFTPGTEETFLV